MEYDDNVLQAIGYINTVLATRRANLWPSDVDKLESALNILDGLRKAR